MLSTLWIQVTCLSPMPSMRCAAEADVVEGGALHRLQADDAGACTSCLSRSPAAMVPPEPIAETNAATRLQPCSRASSATLLPVTS